MKKLLLTGFEPFGGFKNNPSDIIAQELNGQIINSIQVIGSTITLRYKEIQTQIIDLIKKHQPDVVINMGQATRPSISIEKIAINLADAGRIAYNCGSKPDEEKLIREAPDAYFSSLPVKKLVTHLEKNKIPCYVSHSAGTFGCNQIMYYTLHYLAKTSTSQQGGFIHLPLLPDQTIKNPQAPSMGYETMKKGIQLTIEKLGDI
jgi:pyroglutamyl-peptidase